MQLLSKKVFNGPLKSSVSFRWQVLVDISMIVTNVGIKGGAGHRLPALPLCFPTASVLLSVFIFYLLELAVGLNHLLHPAVRVVENEIVGYDAGCQQQ